MIDSVLLVGINCLDEAETNISGVVNCINTTNSTSTTSGALTVSGGLGVSGNEYLGGSLYFPNGGNVIIIQENIIQQFFGQVYGIQLQVVPYIG
jgi:hypothetical protein